ncbi:MAG TPA: CBS domain-containing protein [Tepidisphaeraceae bacterium]|nr:CBS domain-containing protein [Tepidisphaeraceae bacterium]
MPTVQDVLAAKGSTTVHSTSPQATVLQAVQKMNQHKLGALVVMEDAQLVGIFTERDVLTRVVGAGRDPATTRIADVMTREVICCPPDTDLDEVSAIMKQRRIRHLPVCDRDGQLHGMVSIGDVNAYYASNQEATITFLNDYIFGRA